MESVHSQYSKEQTKAIIGHDTDEMDEYYVVMQKPELFKLVEESWSNISSNFD